MSECALLPQELQEDEEILEIVTDICLEKAAGIKAELLERSDIRVRYDEAITGIGRFMVRRKIKPVELSRVLVGNAIQSPAFGMRSVESDRGTVLRGFRAELWGRRAGGFFIKSGPRWPSEHAYTDFTGSSLTLSEFEQTEDGQIVGSGRETWHIGPEAGTIDLYGESLTLDNALRLRILLEDCSAALKLSAQQRPSAHELAPLPRIFPT